MTKALICAENGVRIAAQCRGPSWSGGCPRSLPGAPVACAGRKIVVLAANGTADLVLLVEPDASSCPMAALNLVGEEQPKASPAFRLTA